MLRQVAGWLLSAAFWRPGRSGLQRLLETPARVVVVRLDHRVGEALLTTPLVGALAGRAEVHLVVHPKCVRVLTGLPGVAQVHPFERRWLWAWPFSAQVRALRRLSAGGVVVNAANWSTHSGTNALAARLLGPRACVVGPAAAPARYLMDVAVEPLPGTDNELEQRLHLLAPMVSAPRGAMAFRAPVATPKVEAFVVGLAGPFAVVNPGGRLAERRVPASVFSAACRALKAKGATPVLTWGPGEEPLAREVAAQAPGAVLAPPTDLDELAFLMKKAERVVCNNTGPMHLSVAVGAPTVALFFQMPVSRWGHERAPHRMVDLTPCAGEAEMVRAVEAAL